MYVAEGSQRPENDPVDHNSGLRPAQANSESGPEGPGYNSRRPACPAEREFSFRSDFPAVSFQANRKICIP